MLEWKIHVISLHLEIWDIGLLLLPWRRGRTGGGGHAAWSTSYSPTSGKHKHTVTEDQQHALETQNILKS